MSLMLGKQNGSRVGAGWMLRSLWGLVLGARLEEELELEDEELEAEEYEELEELEAEEEDEELEADARTRSWRRQAGSSEDDELWRRTRGRGAGGVRGRR